MSETVTIARLGAQGDGVADVGGGQVFVPFTLPGETVNIARSGSRGTAMAITSPSPDRVTPPCRHFEDCGGCAVQHLREDAYSAWKRGLVTDALKARGLEAEIADLVAVRPRTRRRAIFTALRGDKGMTLGFNAAMSHRVVELSECHILQSVIFDALPALKRLAALLAKGPKPFQLTVTATASGLDIAATGCGVLKESARGAVTQRVLAEGFARLSVEGEMIVEVRPPQVSFGGVNIILPPGGFLQAVADAERVMADLVTGHLAKARRVVDLFSGCGTFAFPLARASAVHAVDGDKPSIAALDKARRMAQGLKPVSVEQRDLFRRPLTAKELNEFQGVVLDPPRAGAEAQARQIAASNVGRIAAVSCNPATLARDLRILVDAGFAIRSVTPIDQFLWSPHVEVVGLMER